MKKVVLFLDNTPLYLSDVQRDTEGVIVSGVVENGGWMLTINGGNVYAWRHGTHLDKPVSVTPFSTYKEVLVETKTSDYNQVINKAIELVNKENEHG